MQVWLALRLTQIAHATGDLAETVQVHTISGPYSTLRSPRLVWRVTDIALGFLGTPLIDCPLCSSVCLKTHFRGRRPKNREIRSVTVPALIHYSG
jgi:hypothetical protein